MKNILLLLVLIIAPMAHAEPLNILFVYTDDQGPWALGASGNQDIHTPNMDRLVAEGVYCPNSFVTTPVCSPSRVGLLTSRFGTEHGITDWINPYTHRPLVNEQDLGLEQPHGTWVQALKDGGYATALIGKWHLGIQDRHLPQQFGYDYFYGFRPGGNKVENPTLEIEGKELVVEGLTTDILTDAALDHLAQRDTTKPFMLSVHYRAPHAAWLPVSDADWDTVKDKELTLPNPEYPDLDIQLVEKKMHEHLASVAGVDRNLGRLLDYLDENGLAENTVVIFTSDHGYNVGHHGILHKGNSHWITKAMRGVKTPEKRRPNMWDTSLRVPNMIRWPGKIAAGSRVMETLSNLDWYPTLLAMAGLELTAKEPIRGENFLPLLLGESVDWNNDLYGEYSMHHGATADMRMYRTEQWKLVVHYEDRSKDELYHLATDPGETRNLMGAVYCQPVISKLEAKIRAEMEKLGDSLLGEL